MTIHRMDALARILAVRLARRRTLRQAAAVFLSGGGLAMAAGRVRAQTLG